MGETDNIENDAGGSAAGAGSPDRSGRSPGRYAYEGLERVIHEKARLSILSSLAANDAGLLFNDLKALCTLTDGNLSRQLQVLQEAGFVEVWKGVKNNRPQTLCRLTADGRKRFQEYIAVLESVVANAARAAAAAAAAAGSAGSGATSRAGRGLDGRVAPA